MKAKELLQEFETIKSLPIRRKKGQQIAKSVSVDQLWDLIKDLKRIGTKSAWDLIAHLITDKLYQGYPNMVLGLIKDLALHDNWEIREEAATVIKRLNQKHFNELLPVYKKWVRGNNPFLKRAVSVGLIKPFKDEDKFIDEILELFEFIIQCDDGYVKKNAGPFGLAAIFRHYPKITEAKLYEWLDKYADNPNVVWNVMSVFAQANAKYYKTEGKQILVRIKEVGLIDKFPKLRRSFESIKRKVD